jgi:hypothetical protein
MLLEWLMIDPLERATAKPPAAVDDGCTKRFDPDAMSPESGTDFTGADELWRRSRWQMEGFLEESDGPAASK